MCAPSIDNVFIKQHRPDWLKYITGCNLELDYYCKELKLAFEYNGIQHYEPIDAWGGVSGLKKNQERDANKLKKSKKNKVDLRIWHYSKKINEENVKTFISDLL